MRQLSCLRLRLFILIALTFPAALRAQTFADRLPAGALIYAGWCGGDSMGSGYAHSHLQQVISDSQLPEFLNDFLPKVLQLGAERNPQLNVLIPVLHDVALPMFHHPFALSIGKFEIIQGKGPTPHVILICQAGDDSDALLQALRDWINKAGNTRIELRAERQGDLVVFSAGYAGGVKTVLEAGASEGSLASDPKFKSAIGKMSSSRTGVVYVDIDGLRDNIEDVLKTIGNDDATDKWTQFRDQLGLSRVHQIILASGFDGPGWRTQMFVGADETPATEGAATGQLVLSKELLTAIPQTATRAGGTSVNLAQFLDRLRSAIGVINPQQVGPFDQGLDKLSQIIGMDFRKDLLPSFGSQWVYYHDASVGGYGLLGTVLINALPAPEQTEAKLKELGEHIQSYVASQAGAGADAPVVAFKTLKSGGVTVTYLATPFLTPAWAIDHGRLYMGLYPQVVVAAVQQGSANKSLLDNPAFVALHKRLGNAQPMAFEFDDLPVTARETYPAWLLVSRISGFGDLFGVTAPPMLLPTMPKLLAQLEPAASFSWRDKDGFHVAGYSPFPGSRALAVDPTSFSTMQTGLMAGILLPALNKARDAASKVKSASNLRQIGLAAILWSNEHRNRFPTKIGELMDEDITAQVFSNPRSGNPPPPPGMTKEQAVHWVETHSDYVWIGHGTTTEATSDTVIAYEKPAGLKDGLNILYGDGHVEFKMMGLALADIQKSQGAPRERLRALRKPERFRAPSTEPGGL